MELDLPEDTPFKTVKLGDPTLPVIDQLLVYLTAGKQFQDAFIVPRIEEGPINPKSIDQFFEYYPLLRELVYRVFIQISVEGWIELFGGEEKYCDAVNSYMKKYKCSISIGNTYRKNIGLVIIYV